MKSATAGNIEVYTGATHPGNAEQIVTASFLQTDEPAPAGIIVLKLNQGLQFNHNVSRQGVNM